ncbi:MAG: sugar transferase [Oscillospiraceae bacterium]
MVKTVNLAYKEGTAEKTIPPVITVHTNERIRAEREMSMLPAKPIYDGVKRVGDVFCAVAGLVALAPLFLVTAAAIMLNDFGNPIYTQTRIGKNGGEFKIYKFRSMYLDADARKEELMKQNEGKGVNFKMENDPRITKVGMFLRKTSIDELPQLLNILKGDMSVIGPRPFIPEEQERLPEDRLLVRPGLSCYWQIGGGNKLSVTEQIELDRKYIKERSLLTDIKIVGKTILHVLGGKNC